MTITFRDDIGIYTGKGSPLTKGELDENFYDVLTRILTLESGGSFALSSISYTGSSITFHWSDSTTSGPFALPVATFHARGNWLPSTMYFTLDVVSINALGTFLVLQNHLSGLTFDPAATNASDDPLYLMIGESADVTFCLRYRGEYTSGTLYDVYDSFTDPTYGYFAVMVQHTASGALDQYLEADSVPIYRRLAGPAFSPVKNSVAATYNVSHADVGKYIRFSVGTLITFPVDIDFGPGNPEIHFRQAANESLVFVGADETVILNPQRDGFATHTAWKGATVTAKYVAFNEWDLIGPHGDEISA